MLNGRRSGYYNFAPRSAFFHTVLMLMATVVLGGDALGASGSPSHVPIPLANSGFEQALWGTWRFRSDDSGLAFLDSQSKHSGNSSACIRATQGVARLSFHDDHLVPTQAGEAFKLTAWVRTEQATGRNAIRLEGLEGSNGLELVAESKNILGTTGGWVFISATGTVPDGGLIDRLRPVLQSDDNSGRICFDDVALWRLSPDEPVMGDAIPPPTFGHTTTLGGHLVGSDGDRIRFWGVNVVDEMGRSYREITYIPRRIREMGFNAVRLHLQDIRFIDTDARTEFGEQTSLMPRRSVRGDGSILDKLDYFIYRCQVEGLYLYLSFDRRRVKFATGDYEILPSGGPDDARDWKEAVTLLQPDIADEHVYFVDPRLAEAQASYVRQVLDHRNAYTGKRIADDPYIALYELTNENHFPEWMLNGGFREWPSYFQRQLQARWNAWLRKQYGDDDTLRTAWVTLDEHESLENEAVQLTPTLNQADDFSESRLADVHRFIYMLFISYSQRLEKIIRAAGSSSALAPISWDTIHEPKSKWYYPCSEADLVTIGTYATGDIRQDRESCPVASPPNVLTNLSFASILDKATVVYETNSLKPDFWRAAYPLQIAAFASAHDWDGVFWYLWSDGTVHDQFDADTYVSSGLRYANASHQWHGAVISTDEVLLASLNAAGEIFSGFHMPAGDNPVIVTVGAHDLLGPGQWPGELSIPYPENSLGPWKRANALGTTDFRRTVRYRFDLAQRMSSVSQELDPPLQNPVSPVPGLTYDWKRGLISLDTPTAKAAVGFVDSAISFSDNVQLDGIGDIAPRFVCFVFVSTDRRPLRDSRQAILILTTYGENQARVLAAAPDAVSTDVPRFATLVESWGIGPPVIARPSATIQLGSQWSWSAVDFSLNPISEGSDQQILRLPAGMPVFRIDLHRRDRSPPNDH